ncbi:hypothetical protein CC86DRAFT_465405 [Ophiobolus disseminans]|uniref:DUF3112 domain-containing protein n=1 Tax=Ophiobolus disseminans TaxID=1469910 RepID=A0A6A7A7G0_9PLEO|nr:hypothetical protein CC86DRAFT_465405 [Ophiobolus disseminans]
MSDPIYTSERERIYAKGPPYPPHNQGLGGEPKVVPDVPITAAFLVLYLIFGVIHIKIFKANKGRGHKFIFNGAILGLCKIRIITMTLRIAWSCYPRNVGLGIAANVFVYVGTIILFMIDWFFVQRIIRAQHQRLGWSTPYRILHRGALGLLVLTLIMVIMVSIWQFFTINETKLSAFRTMQLIGQTYFTVFCFAPAVLVIVSLLIPRREVEKFGAGRLRVNVTILLLAVTVLTTGQLFRCVIAWLPQTRVRDDVGVPIAQPWYLHRACFYAFNFVTEIVVVIMFAVVRVDLRFHVPNGSRMSGDYSGRNSRVNLNSTSNVALSAMASKKSLASISPGGHLSIHKNDSSETLHQYEVSVFEDSRTLADSLQFGASTLEVDNKTGAWKVKRVSTGSTSSRGSITSCSSPSRSLLHDRSVKFADEAPPVPEVPAEWPLPALQPPRSSMPIFEHSNSPSKRSTPKRAFEVFDHDLNGDDMGDVTDALSKLEQNSETNTPITPASYKSTRFYVNAPVTPPPEYAATTQKPTEKRRSNPLAPRNRATFPPKSALKTSSRMHGNANNQNSTTPTIKEAPEYPTAPKVQPPRRLSSLEFIKLAQNPQPRSHQILDLSLQGAVAADISRPVTANNEPPMGVARAPSSAYSNDTTPSEARETARAEHDFRNFNCEALPVDMDVMRSRRFD